MLREARKQIPGIKREEVREFLETQYAYTRHKPARRKFPKRAVIAVNINHVYQMDLVDLQKFAEFNDGVKYLLTATYTGHFTICSGRRSGSWIIARDN